ncbi:asparaginase [Nakamurella endophytica]|uniref:Asparaginase n=2 Tax=Nakamurella endophytica TaxID=1748367 RepID=A0A917T4M1_9ACTN|nr:asparaginase [Nakamurella endophytica]GGM09125.1 asparaginase [Nakamurella endophytica]
MPHSTEDAPHVPLVHVVRSGFHEGTHFGAVVVTGPGGEVLHARGGVDAAVFPRSSNKPFQAVAMLAAGAELAGADLALASASHSGEPMHTERVQAMLDRVDLTEDDLGCPPALPLDEAARLSVLAAGGGPRRLAMNCSGKHAGMLTACVAAGWDVASYLDPDHPLQQAVARQVAELSGEQPSAVGVDGCGAPLFAVSLTGLARAFGRVAAATDGEPALVAAAMRHHPEMVGGTGREDTRLMQRHPELLVKGGAEGVHCAALPDGSAVAVKISDGGDRARMPVLVAGLRMLGVGSELLDELATGTVLGGGRPVGVVELAPDVF